MTTYRIVALKGVYRIEAMSSKGGTRILGRIYRTEAAAKLRLDRLHAMKAATLPERDPIQHGGVEIDGR